MSYLGQVTVAPGGTDSVASPVTSDKCSDYKDGAKLLSFLLLLLDTAVLDRGERRGEILRERVGRRGKFRFKHDCSAV